MTIGFKEKEKGWVSFFSFIPDGYLRLGGKAFAIKNGQLWEQNDRSNPIVNTFFGIRYPSKISTVFNDAQTEDKIFKTFIIEGSASWNVKLKSNLGETSLTQSNFDKKESRYFAYLRGNEKQDDFNGNSQGIGVCKSSVGNSISFDKVSEFTNIGDKVFRLNNDEQEFVGNVQSKTIDSIILTQSIGSSNGYFIFSSKDSRVDGGEVRGYYADVELENNDLNQVELFAINSNIIKSYV